MQDAACNDDLLGVLQVGSHVPQDREPLLEEPEDVLRANGSEAGMLRVEPCLALVQGDFIIVVWLDDGMVQRITAVSRRQKPPLALEDVPHLAPFVDSSVVCTPVPSAVDVADTKSGCSNYLKLNSICLISLY